MLICVMFVTEKKVLYHFSPSLASWQYRFTPSFWHNLSISFVINEMWLLMNYAAHFRDSIQKTSPISCISCCGRRKSGWPAGLTVKHRRLVSTSDVGSSRCLHTPSSEEAWMTLVGREPRWNVRSRICFYRVLKRTVYDVLWTSFGLNLVEDKEHVWAQKCSSSSSLPLVKLARRICDNLIAVSHQEHVPSSTCFFIRVVMLSNICG